MVEDIDEPICENSDDDLGMDLEDSDDETRYYTIKNSIMALC